MDDLEFVALFTGYGYQACFAEYNPSAESDEEGKKKDLDLNVNMATPRSGMSLPFLKTP